LLKKLTSSRRMTPFGFQDYWQIALAFMERHIKHNTSRLSPGDYASCGCDRHRNNYIAPNPMAWNHGFQRAFHQRPSSPILGIKISGPVFDQRFNEEAPEWHSYVDDAPSAQLGQTRPRGRFTEYRTRV
jgi:hypothetical protein